MKKLATWVAVCMSAMMMGMLVAGCDNGSSGLPKPVLEDGEINDDGVLTKYTGSATEVVIPDGVTKIGDNAFDGCKNLKRVTIPVSVTYIGNNVFSECTSLDTVIYGGTLAQWCGMRWNGDVSYYAKHVNMDDGTDLKSLKNLKIPEGVTEISDTAFSRCTSLESVTIPDGVTKIANGAFTDCPNLKSVTIPDGVMYIHLQAFFCCTSLASVTIPASVEKIDSQAFGECKKLDTVTYGGTKEKWEKIKKGWNIFENAGVTKITCTDGDIAVE